MGACGRSAVIRPAGAHTLRDVARPGTPIRLTLDAIQGYQITHEIARGTTGVVYAATSLLAPTGPGFAVKVVSKRLFRKSHRTSGLFEVTACPGDRRRRTPSADADHKLRSAYMQI